MNAEWTEQKKVCETSNLRRCCCRRRRHHRYMSVIWSHAREHTHSTHNDLRNAFGFDSSSSDDRNIQSRINFNDINCSLWMLPRALFCLGRSPQCSVLRCARAARNHYLREYVFIFRAFRRPFNPIPLLISTLTVHGYLYMRARHSDERKVTVKLARWFASL